MKNKGLKLKIVLTVFLSFVTIFGGLLFYISQKISPEEIKKMTIAYLEENFPNMKVEMGELDYSLGASISFNLNKLEMVLRRDRQKLVSVNDLKVKIPIWAILTGGGSADILVQRPEMHFFVPKEGKSNWEEALEKKDQGQSQPDTPPEATKDKDDKGDKTLQINQLLAKSVLNLKVQDIFFHYNIKGENRGEVVISRFLVKDLSLETPTAFELESNAHLSTSPKENIDFNVLMIGHLNLHEYIAKKELKSAAIITFNNLKMPNLPPLAKITIDLKSHLFPDSSLNVDVFTDVNNLVHLKTQAQLQGAKLSLSNIDINVFLKDTLNFFAPQLKVISAEEAKLNITGGVVKEGAAIHPDLKFKTTSPLKLNVEGGDIESSLEGSFKESDVLLALEARAFQGIFHTEVGTKIDPNNPPKGIKGLGPIKISASASGVHLPEKMIRDLLYKDDKKVASSGSTKDGKVAEAPAPGTNQPQGTPAGTVGGEGVPGGKKPGSFNPILLNLPATEVKVQWNHIKVGSEDFSGLFTILANGNRIASENFDFSFSKGKGSLDFRSIFEAPGINNTDLKFDLHNLNLDSLKVFLPPLLDNLSGFFTGKVQGHLTKNMISDDLKYDINFNVKANRGELKGINLTNVVQSVLDKVPLLKDSVGQTTYKVDQNFETLLLEGQLKEDQYELKKFEFFGIDNSVEIKGDGVLYPLTTSSKKSVVELNFQDKTGKISKVLAKNIGTEVIPIRLTGPQFALTPDYGYTIESLAKAAFKKQKDKLVQKVEQKAKEELNRQIKKNSEKIEKALDKVIKDEQTQKKVDKLLKGIFQ